jgi:hypothetical protein
MKIVDSNWKSLESCPEYVGSLQDAYDAGKMQVESTHINIDLNRAVGVWLCDKFAPVQSLKGYDFESWLLKHLDEYRV